MDMLNNSNFRRASMLPAMLVLAAGGLLMQSSTQCMPADLLDTQSSAQEAVPEESGPEVYTYEDSARELTDQELQQLIANADDHDVVVVFANPIPGPAGPEGPPGTAGGHPLVGEVRMWAGSRGQIPTGWLPCEGGNVSRVTHANLFNAIGTTYGIGDGSTTFTLPDFRDRSPMGASQSGSAGEPQTMVSGAATTHGGSSTHTLVESEIPTHNHDMTHQHDIDVSNDVTTGVADYVQSGIDNGGVVGTLASSSPSSTNTGLTGGSMPHSILHPYFAITYIIFAGAN